MNEREAMVARAEFLSEQYDAHGKFMLESDAQGCTRACIIEKGYAFKAVHKAKESDQNRSEWDFYTMTTDEIRALLAKPLYISKNGRVLVMEALTPWRS